MWSAGQGDDKERFLADLRALRDKAALEFDELAARAHYPSDILKEAESGPSLPSLPILAAYVRACDGDVPEWEERWRRVGLEPRADPSLPVRPAGASPAAVAGARAGVSVAPPDAYDPDRIKAALRGSHGRSDHAARETATRAAPGRDTPDTPEPAVAEPRVPESPANWSAGTSWEETRRWDAGAQPAQPGTGWDAGARWDGAAADVGGTPVNGNHHLNQPGDASAGTAVAESPDAARAGAVRRDPFSAAWLQDEEPASPPDAEPQAAAADSWFTPRVKADDERAWQDETPPEERTGSAGFWTPSAAASAPEAEVHRPAASPLEGQAIPRAWSAPADSLAGDPPGAADRTMPVPAQAVAAAAAVSRTIAGPAVPPGPVVPPGKPRPDRLYPVRLLVVIVVAALIGSILVLLLR
jgi:hypothetical protein